MAGTADGETDRRRDVQERSTAAIMGPMTGVALLLVLAVGVVSLIAVWNVIAIAQAQHEREGLFGEAPRARRLQVEALTALIDEEISKAAHEALVAMVAEFDRLAFAGTPLASASPTAEWGWWRLRFVDGTDLTVQVGDPRSMHKVRSLLPKETIVVRRVHPHPDSAVVELASTRHRPVRVALRS
jgi:hypothetical protein